MRIADLRLQKAEKFQKAEFLILNSAILILNNKFYIWQTKFIFK